MGLRPAARWIPAAGLATTFLVVSVVLSAPQAISFPVRDGQFQPKQAQVVGHLGCNAASCHGGTSVGQPGSECLTWFEGDPHRKAFSVLHNAQSKTIAKNLAGTGPVTPAHRDTRCLVCHGPESLSAPDVKLLAPVGVSCESCHGPASEWVNVHYQPMWKKLSPKQQAEEYGFYPTKDLAFRGRVCASCHVGDEHREVNHDLIAAGHPRLSFEYTAYHHLPNYQKHWKETDPNFEVKAWETGQIACTRAAVSLLKTRAERVSHGKQPWPELSEYGCFSCHKELGSASWKDVSDSKHAPGQMRYGSWYLANLPWLSEVRGQRELPLVIDRLTALAESPTPDPAKMIHEANQFLEIVDRWQAQSRQKDWKPLESRVIVTGLAIDALTLDGKRLRNMEWDESAQHYLGLVAGRFGQPSVPRETQLLLELRKNLAFPVTADVRFDSPKTTNPAQVRKLFQDLRSFPREPVDSPP